jgi:hypothetical protein
MDCLLLIAVGIAIMIVPMTLVALIVPVLAYAMTVAVSLSFCLVLGLLVVWEVLSG